MSKSNADKTLKKIKKNNNEFIVKLYFKDAGLEFKEIIKDNLTRFITGEYLK